MTKNTKRPSPTWYIAPSNNTSDEYAAGYDGNSFPTHEAAERELPLLAEALETEASEWVVVQRKPVCECGRATGVRCDWEGEADDLVVLEWMPMDLRESHRAAGNLGVYPHNGADRLTVSRECANMLIGSSDGWASIVEQD